MFSFLYLSLFLRNYFLVNSFLSLFYTRLIFYAPSINKASHLEIVDSSQSGHTIVPLGAMAGVSIRNMEEIYVSLTTAPYPLHILFIRSLFLLFLYPFFFSLSLSLSLSLFLISFITFVNNIYLFPLFFLFLFLSIWLSRCSFLVSFLYSFSFSLFLFFIHHFFFLILYLTSSSFVFFFSFFLISYHWGGGFNYRLKICNLNKKRQSYHLNQKP